MFTAPSPTTEAIRLTGYRLDEMSATSGRSRPC